MVHLEKITGKNVWRILELEVAPFQRNFVATNTESIVEAYVAVSEGGHAFPFGIYDGDMPVGFLMIGYDAEDSWEDAPQIAHGNYSLWRLMIDKKYQGRGYGRQAIQLALDFIRTAPCGPAESIWLSYEPQNTVAKNLYASCGFQENGEWDGDEIIAVRKI